MNREVVNITDQIEGRKDKWEIMKTVSRKLGINERNNMQTEQKEEEQTRKNGQLRYKYNVLQWSVLSATYK